MPSYFHLNTEKKVSSWLTHCSQKKKKKKKNKYQTLSLFLKVGVPNV